MAGRQKDKERVFNISVVGLSGTDKEKGSCGVGKSCLCNRFIRPQADDYHKEHICVISQSDFSGRVVNNDHFLYWGERKLTYEGQTYSFRIIEQTEFIDDSSFQPFRGNNTGNYLKRCVSVKFGSQDKLMYSCKDQLGDEDNYPKSTFTNGKITIDGFLIVYDSSRVRGRDAEKQIDFLNSLYNQLKKTNKAFVIAVTKCDEAHEYNTSEIDRFSQKHKIQLIETSANEAVNVDLAFVTLVQMIDKSRGTGKRVAYHEANKQRRHTIDKVTDSFSAILRDNITNYHLKWNTMKRFEHDRAYEDYIYHLGTKEARKMFERHIKTLKTNHQRRMLAQYLTTLPSVFDDILPDLVTIGQRGWSECKQVIKEHENFGKWFIVLDGEWQEHPHINQTIDMRIPASIFTTHDSDCESQFKNHINKLSAAKRKERMQSDFRKLLEASKQEVMAGKQYKDVIKHFSNEESFQELSNDECLEIYSSHQEQITRKAKDDFKELLFECADFFAQFDDVKLSHNDLLDIQDKLQSDPRYTALEFLHNDRHALLIKHLAFIQHPTPETCISGIRCMDLLINGHIANAVHRTSPPSLIQSCDDEFQKLNIVILGQEGLAEELHTVIESQCCDGEYTLDGRLHNLQLRAVEGDVSQIQNALKTDQFTPAACICTFSGRESFDYVKSSLEKTILNQESDKELRKLPVIFLFARGVLVQDDEHNEIKEEAQTMSTRLSSTKFVDMPKDDSMLMRGNKFHEQQIQQAIRAILVSTQTPNPHEQTNGQCLMETLKIGLCIMCGDEYSVEDVLSPFVKNDLCFRNPSTDGVFNVVTYIDDKKAKVEIRASSYHGAAKYAGQCHGLILFYSPKRKGSYETMKNFAMKYGFLEIKIVAVCDADKAVKHFELTKSGEEFAQKIDAGFMITGADFGVQTEAFTPFFQDVMMHKNETDDSDSESEHDLDYINTRPQLPTPGSCNYQQDGRKYVPPTDENSTSPPEETNTQDVVERKENENDEKDVEDDETNKSHSDFMAKLKMWEADRFSDIENLSPTVDKPSSNPTSIPDQSPEPIYDVVNPTINDDPEQQKPKPIPPPVKPTRFFTDKGLNTYPRDGDYYDDYKEEENPIYIAASKLPPPVKPKPTERSRPKTQPRKLDMEKFHDIEQVVGNNLVVRTPQSQRGAPHSLPIATPEGYAVPHDVLHMPLHISAGAIYHEPVDAIQGLKPRKFPSNKAPSVADTRTVSGKKKNPPTTPLSPNANGRFLVELEKTFNKDNTKDESLGPIDINNENDYVEVNLQGTDDKESTTKRKKQKKKNIKQKEDQETKRKKKIKKIRPSRQKKVPAQPPPRPPIEECVTGDETVPLFVIKCVEFLEEEGLCQEGIYRIPGKGADSDLITSTFLKNNDINLWEMGMSVPAVCTALKQFFSKLPEPLIPYGLQKDFLKYCTDTQNQEEQTRAIKVLLEQMPRIKKETLEYMMLHLNKIMLKHEVNRMTSQNLAVCWWPTLLHPEYKSLEDMANDAKLSAMVENMIAKAVEFFQLPVEEPPVPEDLDMETESDSSQQPIVASSLENNEEFPTQ